MKLKLLVPISLLIALLATACELSRPGDGDGNIAPDIPVVTGPDATIPAPDTGGDTPPPGPPPETAKISPEGVPFTQAPEPGAAEAGKVLLKLNQQASIQARSAELGANGIMQAGIPTLDQRLEQIGASQLEPVVEKVANALGEDIATFSAEVTEVSQLFSISFSPENDPVEVANLLSQDPTVEFAEPNYLAGITGEPVSIPAPLTPDDPFFQFQWHFEKIQMPTAWDRATGSGVTVAIIDTGIDFNAPDLAGTERLNGHDFINDDPDPTDDHGHGTHVAGTVAQTTNNQLGTAGVAFNARLLPVKVLNASGQGSFEAIIQGMVFAVDQGAQVINLSLAARQPSQSLETAVLHARNRGVVVVAAAGNSSGPVEWPAAYDDPVIAVGATGPNDDLAHYSNFGAQIDLVAPGGDIRVDTNGDGWADGILQQTFKSTGPGTGYSYRFFEGTSMASPHVAGVAALMLSLQPNLSPADIERLLEETARRELQSCNQCGAGLLQAANALAAVEPPPGPTATDTPTPTLTPTLTPPIGEHDGDLPTATPTLTPTLTLTPIPGETPATPTPTVPAPPPSAGELLTNGGFETDEGWIFGDTPIRGGFETDVVRTGSRSARLGATGGRDKFSFSSVWQRVSIPAEANQVTLTAHLYPVSQDRFGADKQIIMILNENFRPLKTLSRELSDSQSWEMRSFELPDLRGQTIYVYFSALNRGRRSGLSALFVDDVSLTWSP